MNHRQSKRSNQAKQDRKLEQLCSQVEEVVSLALGASVDERLHQLSVQSVAPWPDGARLMVTAASTGATTAEDLDALHEALVGARGWLRRQVADEIHRKRTPDLVFQVLPPWE